MKYQHLLRKSTLILQHAVNHKEQSLLCTIIYHVILNRISSALVYIQKNRDYFVHYANKISQPHTFCQDPFLVMLGSTMMRFSQFCLASHLMLHLHTASDLGHQSGLRDEFLIGFGFYCYDKTDIAIRQMKQDLVIVVMVFQL